MTEPTDRPTRKPLSQRLRFEVFKRDGFKCRYCGATPDQVVLHIDHVVPVVDGGGDDPENLLTACRACNLGKADKPLEISRLPLPSDPDLLREQIQQIREYLALQKQVLEAKNEVYEQVLAIWEERIGPMSQDMASRMRIVLTRDPLDAVIEAIDITASKFGTPGGDYEWNVALRQQKYFYGVLKKHRGQTP